LRTLASGLARRTGKLTKTSLVARRCPEVLCQIARTTKEAKGDKEKKSQKKESPRVGEEITLARKTEGKGYRPSEADNYGNRIRSQPKKPGRNHNDGMLRKKGKRKRPYT